MPVPGSTVSARRPRSKSAWAIGTVAGLIALAALVVGSEFGNVHGSALHPKLVAWVSAIVLLVFGLLSTSRISAALSRLLAKRSVPAVGGAVRVVSAGLGYLFVIFAVLAVLEVSVEKLLVGAGLAGVVLGIAAQQSLGNVFAGLVLIAARPFEVGDNIRIRSGALGGIFDARVREMSLTYVTLYTEDGPLKIPNSGMLAAGVYQLPLQDSGPSTATGSATATPVPATPVPATPVPATPVPASPAPVTPVPPLKGPATGTTPRLSHPPGPGSGGAPQAW